MPSITSLVSVVLRTRLLSEHQSEPDLVGLTIVRYETSYGGIIRKVHHHVRWLNSGAIMDENDEESWTEHKTLWHASA